MRINLYIHFCKTSWDRRRQKTLAKTLRRPTDAAADINRHLQDSERASKRQGFEARKSNRPQPETVALARPSQGERPNIGGAIGIGIRFFKEN
jgi:hypothetical protein